MKLFSAINFLPATVVRDLDLNSELSMKQRVAKVAAGHIKNIHLHSCKHKNRNTKTNTNPNSDPITDTGGAVLTLMLGYRRLRIYKLKRKIQN